MLLASLGLRVTVVPSAYAEIALPGLAPADLALRHARGTLAHEYSDTGFVCLRDPAEAVAA